MVSVAFKELNVVIVCYQTERFMQNNIKISSYFISSQIADVVT